MKTLLAAVTLCILVAAGNAAPCPYVISPVHRFAQGPRVALAATNGWCVTKSKSGAIHVVYSDWPTYPTPPRSAYYNRTTNQGENWLPSPRVLSDGNYAQSGVIACLWDSDTLGVAFGYPAYSNYERMHYRQTDNNGNDWWDPVQLSHDNTHYDVRNPSLVMLREQWSHFQSNVQHPCPYAEAVWTDSTDRNMDNEDIPLRAYPWYAAVDAAPLATPPPYGPRKLGDVRLDADQQADFLSIAWEGIIRDDHVPNCFVAFQGTGNPTKIFATYKEHTAGTTPAVVSTGAEPDSYPCIQVVAANSTLEDDRCLLVYQKSVNGRREIWKTLLDGQAEPIPCSTQLIPLGSSLSIEQVRPNIWRFRDRVGMVFGGNKTLASPNFSRFVTISDDASHLHDASSWTDALRLPGLSSDNASVYLDSVEMDVAYSREPYLSQDRQLVLCVLFPTSDVNYGLGVAGNARVLQRAPDQSGFLARASEANDFVSMDLSMDGGESWMNAGSPGYGGKPALALDSDSILCATYVQGCSLFVNWWYPYYYDWVSQETVYAGGSGEYVGQPSVALYPGKSDGVKVAAVSAVVYDSAAGSSRVMFFKVDTGRVVVDTVESVDNLADSFPCLNVANTDSIYLTFQHGDSVVSSKLLDYGRGNWNKPGAWSSLELVTADGYHPMSALEDGDMLHCVWSQRIHPPNATDTFNIRHATCDVSPGAMFPDWTIGTNPSAGATATAEKASSVYAGCGVTCWRQKVSGTWQIMSRVRDTVITLISAPDTNLYCPGALAESSAISPSIDQLRLATYFFKAVVDSGETCGIVCFQCDSFNTSNAGPGATKANSGTKLVRKPSSDSLFAVYADADGGVYLAQSATGDSWRRSEICANGEYPALAYDGTGRLWVVLYNTDEEEIQARYRSGDTWSTPRTLYAVEPGENNLSGISLAGSPDGTTSCAYAAFRYTNSGTSTYLVAAKFDLDSLRLDTVALGAVDAPCIAVENSGDAGDWLHIAWEDNGNVKYTMTSDDWAADDWQGFPDWQQEVTLFESGQQAAHHPCLAANEDKLVVACALGSTPDIYARERTTADDYNDWDDTLNLSRTQDAASDYPVVFLGDSVALAWEEHRSEEDYDILASINYGDTMNLADNATKTSYPHIVLQPVTSPDTTVILHLIASEAPTQNYYEVSYHKLDLADMGGGQQGAGTKPLAIEPALFPCRPNPFTGRTAISYQFPKAGDVSLRVFDASGRMVRCLASGYQKPGKYTSAWDGNDTRGRRVANGIYFYRLDAPDYSNVKKAVLMR